jgi:hypothetical protein
MLKELSIQEFDRVIGGSASLRKLEGTMTTIYRDKDGRIVCGRPLKELSLKELIAYINRPWGSRR